jgi:hypothetical protein
MEVFWCDDCADVYNFEISLEIDDDDDERLWEN